jgi:tetratricopeptide (TPR) repeat protein
VTENNWFVHNGMGSILNSQADLLRANGKFKEADAKNKEAAEHLQIVLKMMPTLASAHTCLGVCYMSLGNLDAAISEDEKSLKFKPNDPLTEGNLGAAYLKKGDLDNAIKHLRMALQLDPSRADSHYNLALATGRRGLIPESVAEFRKVLALYPGDMAAYWACEQIAVYVSSDNRAEAMQMLQRAVDINARAHVDGGNTALNTLKGMQK